MSKKQKVLTPVKWMVVASMLSMIIACSTGGNGSGTTVSKTANSEGNAVKKEEKPLEITMAALAAQEPPADGNEIEKRIEEFTNTKLSIQWIPLAAYADKINLMIASGELPKVVNVSYTPTIQSAMKSGMFWEIGPHLSKFKNLSTFSKVYYDYTEIDGKVYGIPSSRPITRQSLIYRSDWLKNAGLKEPKNLEELYQVLKAFTQNDPDKNGVNDTVGLALEGLGKLNNIVVMHGGPNRWTIENGKLVPDFETKAYMDVLKFMKRLYDEKLMNQDFAIATRAQTQGSFTTGKAGMVQAVSGNAYNLYALLVKPVPQAEVDFFTAFTEPKGKKVVGEINTETLTLIPKSSVKTEEELLRILAFFDKLAEPEMATLLARGIEGKHYKVEDGKALTTDGALFLKEVSDLRNQLLKTWIFYNTMPPKQHALLDKSDRSDQDDEKYGVYDASKVLTSATYMERGKELEQIITDAATQFIMGKFDEAGFTKEIEKWHRTGGDKMMGEFIADYNKKNKK
ncbi:extracellular solute-binding protein [Paenibacillus cymbidii]|uniref:extracellular solute-binding protein n=1 Tax=Paenibacillus cymbidii TaxID=1639034 RepID=UPI0010805A37|nr:extracellular solute-binding protein [Paenibacillus cymbidii]